MLKRKIVKTGIGLLLSLSLFSVSIESSTISAAYKCSHSYVGQFYSTSLRAKSKHQFQNVLTKAWETCTRKDIIECYVFRCKKCGAYSGIGYTKEIFTHSNSKCPYYPREN